MDKKQLIDYLTSKIDAEHRAAKQQWDHAFSRNYDDSEIERSRRIVQNHQNKAEYLGELVAFVQTFPDEPTAHPVNVREHLDKLQEFIHETLEELPEFPALKSADAQVYLLKRSFAPIHRSQGVVAVGDERKDPKTSDTQDPLKVTKLLDNGESALLEDEYSGHWQVEDVREIAATWVLKNPTSASYQARKL